MVGGAQKEGVWHSISSGYKKKREMSKSDKKMTAGQSDKTVEQLSWCHLGSGAFLHCHLCDIYFPTGDCDADVRARVSVYMPVCLNQYEGVWVVSYFYPAFPSG